MKVKDLKRLLENVDDELEVHAELDCPDDSYAPTVGTIDGTSVLAPQGGDPKGCLWLYGKVRT